MAVTLDDIRAAAGLLEGQVVRTPSVPARRLAEASGAAEVVLKLEHDAERGADQLLVVG